MRKIIEVYVRNEEVLTQRAYVGRPVAGHWCTMKEGHKSLKIMSETDKAALEVAEEVAKQTGAELKIYDVGSFKGKMKTILKRIESTPIIIIGKGKIEGVPKKEDLLLFLR